MLWLHEIFALYKNGNNAHANNIDYFYPIPTV